MTPHSRVKSDRSGKPVFAQQTKLSPVGRPLRLLALEPYYDGSHAAFIDGWIKHSQHEWTLLSLGGHHWKWRMRHAAATFADEIARTPGGPWDAIFTTSMLNLAEFRGLARTEIGRLPTVVYFHENQLTYPVRHEDQRDLHFAISHIMTLRAANAVWFNSRFHQREFAAALAKLLRRMPDDSLRGGDSLVRQKGVVEPPGVDTDFSRPVRRPGPMRILWAARWEFDKNPERFFGAIDELAKRRVDFRLSVLGQQYADVPAIFTEAKQRFSKHIDHWGFQPTRDAYRAVLEEADVVVSTADHEFFGLSMVEAMAAGAYPLLPRRLSYPELLEPLGSAAEQFFFDANPAKRAAEVLLADALQSRSEVLERSGSVWSSGAPLSAESPAKAMQRFNWLRRAAAMDAAIAEVAGNGSLADSMNL